MQNSFKEMSRDATKDAIINNKWIILVPFVLYLILAIGIACTRMPWCDEAWFASSAVNLVRNGFMGCTNLVYSQSLDQYTYWQPPLYFLTEALTFKIFGVGLFQVRFISVFFGLIGLIAIYYMAKELFDNDRKLVLLSTMLVGTDLFYLIGASDGRMDMMAASLSLIGFSLYITLRKKHLHWAFFLSNLFICLSGLTHPNGLLGLLVLIFLIVYLDRERITLRTVMIGLVPYTLGAIGWGAYIFQDVAAFKAQFFGNVIRSDTLKWTAVSHELVNRYLYSYGLSPWKSNILELTKIPLLIFFILGFVFAPFILKEKRFRLIWGMLAIYFLGLMFIVGNKTGCYLVWITPLFILNLIALWSALRRERNFANKIFLLAFTYMILFSVAATPYFVASNPYQNLYLSDLNEFDNKYYTGGKIYGSGEITFFYDFDDGTIRDDAGMGYYTGIKPRYFVVEIRYESEFEKFKKDNHEILAYINKNLQSEYSKIFEGKFYTFYERSS